MWTDVTFWKDASWRAFRTFCQTLAAVLAGVFSGFLSPALGGAAATLVPISEEGLHASLHMWAVCTYTAAVAGLISFLQSIDRERAVGAVVNTPQAVVAPPVVAVPAPFTAAAPVAQVVPLGAAHTVVTSCGDSLKA